MHQPTITICLPSYNRAHCLKARLEQLVSLLDGPIGNRVEVLVSNNGSPDATSAVIKEFSTKFRNFRAIELPLNYGADYNFINCMVNAAGDYVWLFGDDDQFLPESVTRVLKYVDDGRYSLIIGNQEIGESYVSREALGERMFHIENDAIGTLSELCASFGYLTLLGFISSMVFRKPQLSTIDWCRHQNYESALVHATVVYECFHDRQAVITVEPIVKVEPPIEHQTREHQLTQDPRINHRMWTLNLAVFFADMRARGIAAFDSSAQFYLVPHCKAPLADHILGSFRTNIAEFREIPENAWMKIRRFLELHEDTERLAKLDRIRTCHDAILKEIIALHTNHQVRDQLLAQMEAMI